MAADSHQDAIAFYESALPPSGWSSLPDHPVLGASGFVLNPNLKRRRFCQRPNGPLITVTMFDRATGDREVRITFSTPWSGPCPDDDHPRGLQFPIPALTPASGVPLERGGGSESDWSATSQTIVLTSLSAVTLEERFADQLMQAGWTREASGSNGALAWSSWTVPREQGEAWQGLLMIVEGPAIFDEPSRSLSLSAAALGRRPECSGMYTSRQRW